MKTITHRYWNKTSGKWDLDSDEFKDLNLLGKMQLLEAKQSAIGVTIAELEKHYILETCKFKVGEKIYYKNYTKNFKCGEIKIIRFKISSMFFYYIIEPLNKGFVKTSFFRAHIKLIPNENINIKKATE